MLLNVVFVHCVGLALANFWQNAHELNEIDPFDEFLELFPRRTREASRKKDYDVVTPNCDQMSNTALSPFVVLLLFRNSGNFLGMGSIIDKGTVLTARRVVENAVYSPRSMLALAGRAGPWWGKGSQVKPFEEIYQSDGELAIGKIKGSFTFNSNVAPIRLPFVKQTSISNDNYAVFGVPRSSVDVPGDPAPKTAMYFVSIESPAADKQSVDTCLGSLPNVDYNETVNFPTSDNGTYGWGCIGSPSVALDRSGKVFQIGVITGTAISERDICHVHTRVIPYSQWIRSHTIINYNVQVPE